MDTTPVLSTTEVIDRVRAARRVAQAAAVEELQMALAWAHRTPARPTRSRRTGARPPCTAKA